MCKFALMLLLALVFCIGLTINAKDGWDRWIYGLLTVATAAAIFHFREAPDLTGWRF